MHAFNARHNLQIRKLDFKLVEKWKQAAKQNIQKQKMAKIANFQNLLMINLILFMFVSNRIIAG